MYDPERRPSYSTSCSAVNVIRTPSDDVINDVVGFRDEDGQDEPIVKMHSLDEHPREHRRIGVFDAADQQLADSALHRACTCTIDPPHSLYKWVLKT